ncbi:MAG TPA: MvdD family ATP-grasp ribosomal peptide maturase [Pyrinomonadaceae bacterium]|jgi:MvdD family ATP-grasp ribosomal peptide maturase|nr:MvdD family ATP-grasp ribosomal peptide maturase [Pyrinomonadaceae bacterium]
MTVLIITHSNDNESVALVAESIRQRGGNSFRFDTDRFPTEVRLVAQYGETPERLTLTGGGQTLDLGDVSAVWHRRLNVAGRLPGEMDAQLRRAALGESRATVMGMLASLKVFRMDAEHSIRRAENKQLQIRIARESGLDTPRTLITNDPEAVRAFARTCERGLITKMLSSFAIYEDGAEKVVFTNPVAAEDLRDLDGLRLCPMTFQEQVSKHLELRVTVVGRRVLAAAIDSQASARAAHDWRRDGVRLIDAWQPYTLPREVEEKLLSLMDYFKLNYGAADFIVTPEGRHVFLEVNPSGEFFWLERHPGLPISQAIAEVLLGHAQRR